MSQAVQPGECRVSLVDENNHQHMCWVEWHVKNQKAVRSKSVQNWRYVDTSKRTFSTAWSHFLKVVDLIALFSLRLLSLVSISQHLFLESIVWNHIWLWDLGVTRKPNIMTGLDSVIKENHSNFLAKSVCISFEEFFISETFLTVSEFSIIALECFKNVSWTLSVPGYA